MNLKLLQKIVEATVANNSDNETVDKKKGKKKTKRLTKKNLIGILGMLATFGGILLKCFRGRSRYVPVFFEALFQEGGLRQALLDEQGTYRTAGKSFVCAIIASTCFWIGVLEFHYHSWSRWGLFGTVWLIGSFVLSMWEIWSMYGLTNLHLAIKRADYIASTLDWSV